MTKPRDNPNRELFGVLGSLKNTSAEKKWWNARFAEEGIDAFLDYYPTKEEELPERLSEMFHFDRRGYIVADSLQKAIVPLLDSLDESAKKGGKASVITNKGGILIGAFEHDREEIWKMWIG